MSKNYIYFHRLIVNYIFYIIKYSLILNVQENTPSIFMYPYLPPIVYQEIRLNITTVNAIFYY
jgi:hypothetical protein